MNLLPTEDFDSELSKLKTQKENFLSQMEDPETHKKTEKLYDYMIERLTSARSLDKASFVKQRLRRSYFGTRVAIIFGIRVFLIGSAIFIFSYKQ